MVKFKAVIEIMLSYLPEKAPTADELETDLHAVTALWFYRFNEIKGGVPEEKHLNITVEKTEN